MQGIKIGGWLTVVFTSSTVIGFTVAMNEGDFQSVQRLRPIFVPASSARENWAEDERSGCRRERIFGPSMITA